MSGSLSEMSVLHGSSSSRDIVADVARFEPALSGLESGWQVWHRLLLALDITDILRFWRHLAGLQLAASGAHREPEDDREHEAVSTGPGRVRNRSGLPSSAPSPSNRKSSAM